MMASTQTSLTRYNELCSWVQLKSLQWEANMTIGK